ncbi:hypothetical protein MMC07_006100 [Pseudocyphellaria aurata]|nr:hypothetical protein [Pseudocyphellaria aurata]
MSAAADVHGPRDVGRGYSSSPDLSSPPSAALSPTNISPSLPAAQPAHVLPSQDDNHRDGNVGGEKANKVSLAKYPAGPKKVRKKREPYNKGEKASSTTATDGREVVPKVRKTRGPYNTSNHTGAGRKKKAVVAESHHEPIPPPAPPLPRQTKITDPVRSSLPPRDYGVLASHPPPHQNGNNEVIPKSNMSRPLPAPMPRSSSGQNYDPIRSATIEPRNVTPLLPFNAPVRSPTPPRPPPKYTSASASPSIASLIEPASSAPAYNFPKPPKRNHDIKPPLSPTNKKARLSPPPTSIYEVPKAITHPYGANVPSFKEKTTPPADMDMDPVRQAYAGPTSMVKISNSTSTGASSAAHSPKSSRPKEPPVPIPSGNGLLSSAVFGGAYDGTGPEKAPPTVILHVSLDGGDNKYVNFARMAEERYGFNALHPRLAVQRERLARVAAAGAAIENAHKVARNSGSGVSADEMSVDLSENDLGGDDSNMEMGGPLHDIEMGGMGRSGGEGSEATLVKKAPKKRLMREDYYDKDDPFVDDTEMAWEEQQAASKDGFFVYSGPLVQEGEKAVVERADGTTKRGRGKGRGGGTRGTRGAAVTSKAAPAARKPRVTKAARVLMEQEKVARENMAILAAKPMGYPG